MSATVSDGTPMVVSAPALTSAGEGQTPQVAAFNDGGQTTDANVRATIVTVDFTTLFTREPAFANVSAIPGSKGPQEIVKDRAIAPCGSTDDEVQVHGNIVTSPAQANLRESDRPRDEPRRDSIAPQTIRVSLGDGDS